jgi:hypothetical protein
MHETVLKEMVLRPLGLKSSYLFATQLCCIGSLSVKQPLKVTTRVWKKASEKETIDLWRVVSMTGTLLCIPYFATIIIGYGTWWWRRRSIIPGCGWWRWVGIVRWRRGHPRADRHPSYPTERGGAQRLT